MAISTLDQTIAQKQHTWLSRLVGTQTFWVLTMRLSQLCCFCAIVWSRVIAMFA